jgi:beta-glucosidase
VRTAGKYAAALVEAWLPGEKGGQAVAEVLFGDVNPSGKLSVTFPRHVGQLPVYYNHKKSKRQWIEHGWGNAYADMSPEPLYSFGHGLSYTSFAYSNLRLSSAEIGPGGSVQVSLEVQNTGSRSGKEVVQLYLEDVIATVATPVASLRGFQKIELDAGESRTVTFTISPEHLALYDRHLEHVVEPGRFQVMVGSSVSDIRLSGEFSVVD